MKFNTIPEALEMGVELYEQYMPRLKEFKEEWKTRKVTKRVYNKTTGKSEPREIEEKYWYGFEDFYNELKRELNDHDLIKALTDQENENTPANQYIAWFATIKR